ncbi:hypothetical protein CKAN_01329200 [Cinnamomum micranthum f. kanehirae]|uniref:Uncharacterized protein n=1 Tax=Cinnamomum micranthum f. kanehirae TaxID=337451 RepID=A0A443P175_9MAGN|nr:hypothetical protein CKAN_01329200 [Cinnamomum micranthum f. kanehirae]
MQILRDTGKPARDRSHAPARTTEPGRQVTKSSSFRNKCPASPRPRSGSAHRDGSTAPVQKLRRRHGDREVLRRALSPPVRRSAQSLQHRWNFRPTPSRLCNMSMA